MICGLIALHTLVPVSRYLFLSLLILSTRVQRSRTVSLDSLSAGNGYSSDECSSTCRHYCTCVRLFELCLAEPRVCNVYLFIWLPYLNLYLCFDHNELGRLHKYKATNWELTDDVCTSI